MNDRPHVTVHYAQTLDGRLATRGGDSRWVSSDASLRWAHQLRAECAAVMVGVGTVLADDPRLTVRLVAGANPTRVVLDSTLRLPLEATVLTDKAAPTIILTTRRAARARIQALRRRVTVLVLDPDDHGRVDIAVALQALASRGHHALLVEGGSAVITSLLRAGLVDRLTVCIAPKIVGAGVEAVGDLGIQRMAHALDFSQASFMPLGPDMVFDGRLSRQRQLIPS